MHFSLRSNAPVICNVMCIDEIMEFFSNPTVSAFFGALFAFLLVTATDWRRRRRTKRLLTYLVSDNIDHARAKLESVRTNIALLKEDNKITGAPFIRFPTESIKQYQHDILDMLNANEKQALDALVFWMEAIDDLIRNATAKANEVKTLIRHNASIEEKTLLVNEFVDSLEEAESNLNHFIELAGHYKNGEAYKILEFQHPIGNEHIT